MKKGIAVLLSLAIIISACFVGCKKDTKPNDKTDTTQESSKEESDNVIGFEDVEATDKDGKKVTDKNGKVVTTQVPVEYVTNKKGKTIARVIDSKTGEPITNKKGKEVTVDTDYEIESIPDDPIERKTTKKEKNQKQTTVPTKKGDKTTGKYTTKDSGKVDDLKVPKTTDSGERVVFSKEDQQILKNMLEVPYLYKNSYENTDGVPIEIATHAAIWMAEREGLSLSTYAAGTIIIDLFKYFGQTVIHFKTKCNDQGNNENIVYNPVNGSGGDSFTIKQFEEKQQTVTITKIEDLKNNYYRVTASVSGAKGKKTVYAIVQRNLLDLTLGFSIKALRWE